MADTTKKFKWYHVCFGVVILFILAVGGCVGSIMLGTQGAVTETNEFFEMLSNENASPGIAYEETSVEFQAYTSQQDFAAFLREYPITTEVVDISIASREISSDNGYTVATLEGTLHGEDGSTSPLEIQLVKESGEWKVLFFSLEYTE